MTKYLIFTISALIIVILLALCPRNTSKAFAQLTTSNNNAMITILTTNSIQGNNFVIKQEEPVIRKAILSNIDNALFIAKGSVKSAIPVNMNAKIINQLANGRVDTTQGIDMTKRLTATELINAINTTTTNSIVPFHLLQKPAKGDLHWHCFFQQSMFFHNRYPQLSDMTNTNYITDLPLPFIPHLGCSV
jgi:hypothetical protein